MALRPHVILREDDRMLARILSDFFADEDIGTTLCGSVEEIERALDRQPSAVVVTDTWTGTSVDRLADIDKDGLLRLAARVRVIVTTTHLWGTQLDTLGHSDTLVPLPKPYDLDELLRIVREGAPAGAAV